MHVRPTSFLLFGTSVEFNPPFSELLVARMVMQNGNGSFMTAASSKLQGFPELMCLDFPESLVI